jgi:hypothetical protein
MKKYFSFILIWGLLFISNLNGNPVPPPDISDEKVCVVDYKEVWIGSGCKAKTGWTCCS